MRNSPIIQSLEDDRFTFVISLATDDDYRDNARLQNGVVSVEHLKLLYPDATVSRWYAQGTSAVEALPTELRNRRFRWGSHTEDYQWHRDQGWEDAQNYWAARSATL